MQISKLTPETVRLAVDILKAGGLVIYPTETLYGAGVDATNELAVKKLLKYKKRPLGKPISIAVTDQEMAQSYAELNDTAKKIYQTFLPGPVTVISKSCHKTAPGVESELGTVGIRIPAYPLVIEMVNRLGRPITATSANASYQRRPYKLEDIWENISNKQRALIDLAIDAGELPRNEPSTVVDTTLDDITVLRQGDISLKEKVEILTRSPEETQNLGKELWQKYQQYQGQRAVVFALEGEMGAGKTQLTKGIARGMGITEEIVSPTFNLELDYNGKLVHVDAWRLASGQELENLGLKQRINDKSVVAIEWADRVADEIKKYNEEAVVIWVKITYGKGEAERLISWGAA
jgi:L-threonylcarbamoyladenylate synthase